MTTHTAANIPEYVIVREMDRAIQMAEDAKRLHDQLAAEIGYERVRVNHVVAGDKLRNVTTWATVAGIRRHVDASGVEMWYVDLLGDGDGWAELFDDGELVSRLLPDTADVF